MAKPDLFAKRTLATQTESLTKGAASWKDAPEIGLERVQSDGILIIHDPIYLRNLPSPWNLVHDSDEVLLEFKMQGDHIDRLAVLRMLLRRQAREVQRADQGKNAGRPWLGSQTIWIASAYMPAWAKKRFHPAELAKGCYRWNSELFTGLWIAANELPLRDELVPFLITRTGQPLREFLRWAMASKPWKWVTELLSSITMLSQDARHDAKYGNLQDDPDDDEDLKEQEEQEAGFDPVSLLLTVAREKPEIRDDAIRFAARLITRDHVLEEARQAVVRVLQSRKLDVRPRQLRLINTCMDLSKLHQWLTQAATATSADEALATD